MITQASVWGALNDRAQNGIFDLVGAGAPVSGTTGAPFTAPGSTYTDTLTGIVYFQAGTLASPVWSAVDGPQSLQQLSGTISSANIVATGAGQFGHANGVILVPAPGVGKVVELVSVAMFYDFSVAAYTAGGNITVNNGGGGAALTGLISAANSVGAAVDKMVYFVPLSTAAIVFVDNGPINLVSSAAFTQPGTAAGVIRWVANFRQYNTGF